jgi:hypothetical protein
VTSDLDAGSRRAAEVAIIELPATVAAISNQMPPTGLIFVTIMRSYPQAADNLDHRDVTAVSCVLRLQGPMRFSLGSAQSLQPRRLSNPPEDSRHAR